jgi:hypothetical protein
MKNHNYFSNTVQITEEEEKIPIMEKHWNFIA